MLTCEEHLLGPLAMKSVGVFIVCAGLLSSFSLGLDQPKQNLVARSDSYECPFCELVMFTIYSYITENSTQQQVQTVVSEVCNYVPTNDAEFVRSSIFLLITTVQ